MVLALMALALATLFACSASTTAVLPSAAEASAFVLPPNIVRACAVDADPSIAHCLALVRTDAGHSSSLAGFSPSDLQSAYGLPSAAEGGGQTIAIVDAYDDPNLEGDLVTYRSNFALPACTTSNGCFTKVNQKGQRGHYPGPNSGWALEESLDVDMVSAVCPNCHILVVEANNSSLESLGRSVDEAVKLGANVVSNSYVGYGVKGTHGAEHYNHPGTILTAAAGDRGYRVGEPAGLPTVVSVGGTSLKVTHNRRGWTETAWAGTGSGCEKTLAKPSWQVDGGCAGRTMNDVAAVGDPVNGVAVYDTYQEGGWIETGGTSAASPIVAAIYGLAGNAGSTNAAQSLYAGGASLWDVTSGSNGSCRRQPYLCTAGPGYDGPTGNGTPNGVSAF